MQNSSLRFSSYHPKHVKTPPPLRVVVDPKTITRKTIPPLLDRLHSSYIMSKTIGSRLLSALAFLPVILVMAANIPQCVCAPLSSPRSFIRA